MTGIAIHLLIIDDSAADRAILRRALQSSQERSYVFYEAGLGRDGLAICRSHPITCVLLDYLLPDMDGVAFLDALAAGGSRPPVVMLTAHGSERVAVQAIKRGAYDYLLKGTASAERLALSIDQAIEQAHAQRRIEEQHRQIERANQDLRQTQAMLEQALRLKDEFLANMSHELRTPLNAILGRAELLADAVLGPLNDRQAATARSIAESGRHLLALINDILDISKIEAGVLSIRPGPVMIEDLCGAAIRMVSQHALARRQHLSLHIESPLPALRADERRLKQILVNLLANAVRFTPEGGALGLEVARDREGTIAFTVWDTGIGIAAEDQDQIFRPFVQVDRGLTREYEGAGLGLALVDQLTRLHGGSVALVSSPGVGSRFCVRLPYDPTPALPPIELPPIELPPIEPPPIELLAGPRLRVLVAEDNPSNVSVLRDYLEALGYEVAEASDGQDAIAQARAARPDVILMDIQMPRMNGLEATRQIRADPNLAQVAIIAVTALAMPGDRERCMEAGADAYFSKPVALRALAAEIEALIKKG